MYIITYIVCTVWAALLPSLTRAQTYQNCIYQQSQVVCARAYREQLVTSLNDCVALCNADQPRCAGADFSSLGYTKVCRLYSKPLLPPSGETQPSRRSHEHGSRSHEHGHHRGRRGAHGNVQCGYTPPRVLGGYPDTTHYRPNCGGATQPPPTEPPPTPTPETTMTATTTTITTTPTTTTSTIVLPPGTVCPAGTEVRYLLLDGVALNDQQAVSFAAQSLQQCLDACTDNRAPNGQQVACQSIDYADGNCRLNVEALRPEGTGTPQESPDTSFYEKMCIAPSVDRQCPGPYYLAPNYILVGFAQLVLSQATFEMCMQQCVNSRQLYAFDCRSGIFFYEEATDNCILNYETKDSQPSLFVPLSPDEEPVDYFEPRCQNDAVAPAAPVPDLPAGEVATMPMARSSGALSKSETWGMWGACNPNGNLQTRYRMCTDLAFKKCGEKETRACTVSAAQPSPAVGPPPSPSALTPPPLPSARTTPPSTATTAITPTPTTTSAPGTCSPIRECCPLLKANGEKDCANGMRLGADLKRITCSPPKC